MPTLPPAFVVSADSTRLRQFREAWRAVGLPADAVAEWRACMIPGDGRLGNAVSQYSLVRHALAAGLDSLLVFEDDAVPCDDCAAALPAELEAARERGDGCVRLGWIAGGPAANLTGRTALGSHAWALLSRDALVDYAETWPRQGKADVVFGRLALPVSLASRCLFLQHVPAGTETPAIHTPRGWVIDWYRRKLCADYDASYRTAARICGGVQHPATVAGSEGQDHQDH